MGRKVNGSKKTRVGQPDPNTATSDHLTSHDRQDRQIRTVHHSLLVPIGRRRRAVVPDRSELVRRRIGGEPLLHRELLLSARLVYSGGRDLDVVDVPPVARPGSVGGEIHGADRAGQARAATAEDIEVSPLEVVVAGAHEPAPRLQIFDPDPVPGCVVESQADDGVGPTLDDRTRPHVHRVHAIRVVLQFSISPKI